NKSECSNDQTHRTSFVLPFGFRASFVIRHWSFVIGFMKFAVRKRRAPSIIIVSLVDILTILLIFFVVSTTFKSDQPQVQINLPESKTATKAPAELEHAIDTVDETDDIKLNRRPIDVDELQRAVGHPSPTSK